ncbi:mediator of RNA polymerase II transcription subunit 24-like isoform X2 [Macrobrachium nipponense]|uniref:mediator of RNA polymerase II transcription subunit 24-like isoform X2 n=1 Tax=Macrobrachium nipponense TaxID=159736 RepID=UPI0030C8025F
MVLETVSSSKAGTIRSLLIRAWRERWSDLQWGIHIKTVLPRAVSGDIYHLADYILQQALMGPLPNSLILSYLRHSLSSQIVSYGGVIESISNYDGLHKPHCVQSLLELLKSMMKSVSCRGKPEDCLVLATALVNGVKWLIQVMGWTTQQLLDLRKAPEHTTNLSLAVSVLQDILDCQFLTCMLEIGRREEPSVWSVSLKKMAEVETLLAGAGSVIENKDGYIKTLCQLRDQQPLESVGRKHRFDSCSVPLCYAMHSIIMLEVNQHTTRDAATFAQQLLLLQRLQGLNTTELYFEILRCSFIGLSSPEYQSYQELKWVGFTFIKVPVILQTIHVAVAGESATGESEDLLAAIKRLAQLNNLLDQVDLHINCNCMEFLLNELCNKTSLLLERDAQAIIATRLQESNVLANIQKNDAQGSHPGNPSLILRAQPPVSNILKTLSNKNQDSALPVMTLLVSGKSRDLLLAAAAASGNLLVFAQKVVKFNELSMEAQPGETPKMAISRAQMFDISFLLLCHIVQIYGIDVVVSEKCETFIEQWMRDNMPELGKVKAPLISSHTDQSAVEDFIRQVNITDIDMKYNMVRWNDVCQMAGAALKEVVTASQHGALPIQQVKELLDRLRYHLCCLPICAAAWLCSHVQVVDGDQAVLPFSLLQYLQTSLGDHDSSTPTLENFKDRSSLLVLIVENMLQVTKGGIHSSSAANNSGSISGTNGKEVSMAMETNAPSLLSSQEPLSHLLKSTWQQIFPTGILSHKALSTFQDLLRLGGTRWFVNDLVQCGMQIVFTSDLNRAVDLIYGLLHLDVVGCTLSFLVHALPLYMTGPNTGDLLCGPRTCALSRLTVMMIISAWLAVQQPSLVKSEPGTASSTMTGGTGNSRKRTYHDRELEEMEANLQLHSGELAIPRGTPGLSRDGTSLLVAVESLLKLMTQVSRAGVVSPVSQLVVNILHELIGAPYSHTLLTLTPPALLPNLVPLLSEPDSFTYAQLLAITSPKAVDTLEGIKEFAGDLIDAQTPAQAAGARRAAAKLLCVQRNLTLSAVSSLDVTS